MTKGTITQVSGSVVDVRFPAGQLPRIAAALSVQPHQVQHIGDALLDLLGGGPDAGGDPFPGVL